jgi:hypothetical protein
MRAPLFAFRMPKFTPSFVGGFTRTFASRMTPELSETSIGQFNLLVNGHFAEFAESFGSFFFREAPARIFGGRESGISRICLRLLLECCSRPKGQTEVDYQDGGRGWAGPSGYCVL